MAICEYIDPEIFQSNLSVLRDILGMTTLELSKETGLSTSTINAIETGQVKKIKKPTVSTLVDYIDHLDEDKLSPYQKYWIREVGTKPLYTTGEKIQGQLLVYYKK